MIPARLQNTLRFNYFMAIRAFIDLIIRVIIVLVYLKFPV
ncbi:hypothetical protein KR50_04410 [Jeotgalibacillus campisalis]|uniref:Uncharacterized protein n=1 Tax=Jeotgalibacillus campisalis TaxID=220754 RepID=A0A0C2VW56_9BACL|nr:hypothetical protein KR50_04410 [Jeotgalibacillus campisalis]